MSPVQILNRGKAKHCHILNSWLPICRIIGGSQGMYMKDHHGFKTQRRHYLETINKGTRIGHVNVYVKTIIKN